MKVLVTGGAGFIGSNICLRLINKGYEVICLDNFSTGYKKNMLEFIYNPLFHFIIHDITEPFPAANVDLIVHCAMPDLKDPLHFLKTCSYGTFNVAGMARRNNAKLMCISNSKIYDHQKDSSDTATGYHLMESILNNYKTLDCRILRFFDVYGPKMSQKTFLENIVVNIINNKNINIEYSEKSLLSCCYISDVIDGFACAINIDQKRFNGPIDLGATQTISIKEFIDTVIYFSKSKSIVTYNNLNTQDLFNITPDLEKAKSVLNWNQKVDYLTGIKNMVEFYTMGPNRRDDD